MKILPLTVACPGCGSREVVYSCEPECCFNHVCSTCYSSFELFTRALEEELTTVDIQPNERDSLAPTVSCVRCKSLAVYSVEDDESSTQKLVCGSCHSLLELDFSSVDLR